MRLVTVAAREMKKGAAWLWRVSVFLALWTFRILLRLVPLAVLVFSLEGGCFLLKSYIAGKIWGNQEPPLFKAPKPQASYTAEERPPVSPMKREGLQSHIRAGQFEARSLDYTFRSVKRDIGRWFKKR